MSSLKPYNELTVEDLREAELYPLDLTYRAWFFPNKTLPKYEIAAKLVLRLERQDEVPTQLVLDVGTGRSRWQPIREREYIIETVYSARQLEIVGGEYVLELGGEYVLKSLNGWYDGEQKFKTMSQAYQAIYDHAQNQIGQNGSNKE